MTSDPNFAIAMIIAGMVAIYLEFCRPGWVIPGVAGGVIVTVGLASIIHWMQEGQPEPISWAWMAFLLIPFTLLSLWLAKIAIQAKRNKAVRGPNSPETF